MFCGVCVFVLKYVVFEVVKKLCSCVFSGVKCGVVVRKWLSLVLISMWLKFWLRVWCSRGWVCVLGRWVIWCVVWVKGCVGWWWNGNYV